MYIKTCGRKNKVHIIKAIWLFRHLGQMTCGQKSTSLNLSLQIVVVQKYNQVNFRLMATSIGSRMLNAHAVWNNPLSILTLIITTLSVSIYGLHLIRLKLSKKNGQKINLSAMSEGFCFLTWCLVWSIRRSSRPSSSCMSPARACGSNS